MNIIISQPMFFPWVGIFEQIRLADAYVHYSNVQFSKGSFVNRVQVKTAEGVRWLTVPLNNLRLGQRIDEVSIDNRKNWRQQHLTLLWQAYAKAPFVDDALKLVEAVYGKEYETIDQLSIASLDAVCRYFGLHAGRKFIDAKSLNIEGCSSRRVLDIVLALGGDTYITGLGALQYLDHGIFEDHGVSILYMDYRKTSYAQLHGEFTPYVSIFDLIANEGKSGLAYIHSEAIKREELISNG